MPTFGQHETAQRLSKSGVGTLFTLGGGGDNGKVLKILEPLSGVWHERHLREEVDAFLLRLKTQQLIAKASTHWAPVHEVKAFTAGPSDTPGVPGKTIGKRGTTVGTLAARNLLPAGAFALLDRYERSVHSLIDSRVRVTNADLRNLVGNTLRALIDLKTTLKRPHGNLKSNNILLKNSADLATATVHLTDPAADGSLTPQSANKDLADLAKILFELVNLHPYAGGTIGPNKEWSALGPNGEDWRKLCNALIDPGSPADERDPQKIVPRIDTWILEPKKSKAPMIAAAVFGALIVGGIAIYFLTRPPRLNYDQASWEKLCLANYAWFGDFMDSMSDDEKKKLSAPPYPSQIVKLLNDAGRNLPNYAPQSIAKQGQTAKYLAANPTDYAKTGAGPYYTQQGDELIENVEKALTPAQWPLLSTLDATASTWEKRGWYTAAGGVRNVIAAAKPPVIPVAPVDINERLKTIKNVDILASIDTTIKAASTVETVAQVFSTLGSKIKQLPPTDVALLNDLPKFAEEFPRTGSPPPATTQSAAPTEKPLGTLADVQALATSFKTIEGVVDQLAAELQAHTIDFSELAKDPAAEEPADGKLTLVTYSNFAGVLHDYRKLPTDPRAKTDWEKGLSEVKSTMVDVITKANSNDTHLPKLVADLEKVQQAYISLKAIPAIEKNKDTLYSLNDSTEVALKNLTDEGNEFVSPYIVHPTEFIAQQRARLTNDPLLAATPVVRDQWVKADTAFLDKVTAESNGLSVYQYAKYQDYVRKFKTLESTYADFDTKIPAKVQGLSSIEGTDWRHAIAVKVAVADRDAALTDLMTNPALHWSDDLPQVDEPGYQSFQRERIAAYERLRADSISLLADFSSLENRLNNLDLQPDEPTPNAPSWRTLAAKWKSANTPLLSDPDITAALRPLNIRVADLLAIDPLTDYKSLQPLTTAAAPEVVLTSWRKIGSAPVNESLPVLTDEDAAETHLATLLAASTKAGTLDNAKAAAIAAEVKSQRPARWRHWTSTLSSAAPLQTALDKRAAFNVTFNPQSDARLIFDDAYYNLRKQSDANLKEADLKNDARSFRASVTAMPAAITSAPAVRDLLARISKPLDQSNEESSSAGAGPKLAGWEQDPSPNAATRLFYFPNRAAPKYTVAFDRLTVGSKTIYLATTEMPFGLFAELANAHLRDLDNAGKSADKQHWFKTTKDAFDGPRVWSIASGKFVLNNAANAEWISLGTQRQNTSQYYPNSAQPPAPSDDMPMQQLSPWSAAYAASFLGCRLPTSDEWKAAYEKFEATGPQNSAWNLRGAAWQAQQDFAKQNATNGVPFPDVGMFNTPDLMFAGITADAATPWRNSDLAKLAPARAPADNNLYTGSALWFRKIGAQPGAPSPTAGGMHDLVGNVAEYTLDGPTVNGVIKRIPSPNDLIKPVDAVDALIAANGKGLAVIGGSSLSPPQIPFNQPQALDPDFPQSATGFSDVGFRLAYTAPIDSINDVLAAVFKDPKYLPPGNVK